VWLAVAGVVLLFGVPTEQRAYDAVVHAVFLGYVFSMIMAHATSILPAVLRIALPYRPAFWVPIALLQVALIVRLWIGDGLGMPVGWQIGGVLGVIALLLFVVTALASAVMGPTRDGGRS
jgi:membrane protein CcdC involved in cytochrome C biogenesis